ncbi:MAG: hypothetical protein ACOC56_06910 [Atribacterota bacterium]
MNWYKIAQEITDFKERNHINSRIRLFKDMVTELHFLCRYITQNPPDAQARAEKMAKSKEMSSYPEIRDKLFQAVKVARDNYKLFQQICANVESDLYQKIIEMQKEREEFVTERLPKKFKNTFSDDK